jgi:hypothetical protein
VSTNILTFMKFFPCYGDGAAKMISCIEKRESKFAVFLVTFILFDDPGNLITQELAHRDHSPCRNDPCLSDKIHVKTESDVAFHGIILLALQIIT